LRAATGTPVMAMAAGKVAFAGTMDVRGNIVIVDHGYGVFSTYCHFSVINVVRGQNITQGQILGMSGNTGRSNGPHLHWEMNINGQWIDSVDFMSMWMPG
jgi:murein DD-endopeptidase MepM/ murein hydrolase activator NlpD